MYILASLDLARRNARSDSPLPEGTHGVPDSKVQVPILASKAFLSPKSLALKIYPKVRLEIEAEVGFPPSYNPSPWPRTFRPIWGARPFFRDFVCIQVACSISHRKSTKQIGKSTILPSQNPPQTRPKSTQNRCPKKQTIFRRCFFDFLILSEPRCLEN